MNIATYKNLVKSMSDDDLVSQHATISELRETCWDNAQDCNGVEMKHWLDEYNEANDQLKVLENEISFRHLKI